VSDDWKEAFKDEVEDARRRAAEEASRAHPNGHKTNGATTELEDEYRFKLIDASELKLNKRSAYLIKNMIPAQGLIIVYGPPKCGKSFWVIDALFHIALEWEYRGRRVKQGLAVYVGCEGASAVPARIEAFRQEKIKGPIDSNRIKVILTRLDLVADIDRLISDIEAQLGDLTPAIIAIDTLNRSLRGSESNDEDMSNYIKAADRLGDKFKCAVVIVHHCGVEAARPRGHTSLAGAGDAQIAVKKTDRLVSTNVEFMKDGPDGETTISRFRVVDNLDTDEDGEPISSLVLEEIKETWAAANAKGKGAKPPSPVAQKFYGAFGNARARFAEARPGSGNRPSITEDQWILELVRGGLIDPFPSDPDKSTQRTTQNRRNALMSKYRRELVAANWISCNGKIIWSIKEEK
jgi:hypothetical protein